MDKILVIAEIGECFNGNIQTAKRLIGVAKEAGCDMVKFQTLDRDNIKDDDPEREWFMKIALTPAIISKFIDVAHDYGIDILFTPENRKTAAWLTSAGLKDVKIASSSLLHEDLLEFVGRNFKRVFISTGLASLKEVDAAVKWLDRVPDLYLLHCVAEYPTGPLLKKRGLVALQDKDIRLNMMRILMKRYPNYKIGYSDHSSGILAPVIATAMGAQVLEKHITLSRKQAINSLKKCGTYRGTDHILSLEPRELKKMVSLIRETECIMGRSVWQRTPGERLLRNFMRQRFNED